MRVLTIDVGGTNIKLLAAGQEGVRKFASGPILTAEQMVKGVQQTTSDWEYDVISMGYPGTVSHGKILQEPKNRGSGWMNLGFAGAFHKPIRVISAAAMQALGR